MRSRFDTALLLFVLCVSAAVVAFKNAHALAEGSAEWWRWAVVVACGVVGLVGWQRFSDERAALAAKDEAPKA